MKISLDISNFTSLRCLKLWVFFMSYLVHSLLFESSLTLARLPTFPRMLCYHLTQCHYVALCVCVLHSRGLRQTVEGRWTNTFWTAQQKKHAWWHVAMVMPMVYKESFIIRRIMNAMDDEELIIINFSLFRWPMLPQCEAAIKDSSNFKYLFIGRQCRLLLPVFSEGLT